MKMMIDTFDSNISDFDFLGSVISMLKIRILFDLKYLMRRNLSLFEVKIKRKDRVDL